MTQPHDGSEYRRADVVVVDGRLVLVVDAAAAGIVAALIDSALSARYRLGQPPRPAAHEILSAAKAAHAYFALGIVPAPEPQLATGEGLPGSWITTEQAAQVLHIGQRAVVKRVASGSLDGRKVGGRWLVRLDTEKAAA